MSDLIVPSQIGERQASVLDRIADALGCSTQDFFQPSSNVRFQALEFLRLWSSIENEQDLAKVREFIRAMTAKSATPDERAALARAKPKPE